MTNSGSSATVYICFDEKSLPRLIHKTLFDYKVKVEVRRLKKKKVKTIINKLLHITVKIMVHVINAVKSGFEMC